MSIETPNQTSTFDKFREQIFDDLNSLIDRVMPDTINGAKNLIKEDLKRELDRIEKTLENDTLAALKQIGEEVSVAIKNIDANKERAIEDVMRKLDDWAAAFGADPVIVAGLKLLGLPESISFIKQMVEGMERLKNGRTDITMDYRILLAGFLTFAVAIGTVFFWLGTVV